MWPVEVQREVSPRVVAKWAKSLELCGRLALVLYHEEARRKQQMILFEARYKLPVGSILLSSIEAMEVGRLGLGGAHDAAIGIASICVGVSSRCIMAQRLLLSPAQA